MYYYYLVHYLQPQKTRIYAPALNPAPDPLLT